MKISELKSVFNNALAEFYPSEEINSFFYLLTEYFLKLDRLQIALEPEQTVTGEARQQFSEAILKLKYHQPIQYIIGSTEFYSLPFLVTPATLIPRPETEELVEWILKDLKIHHPKTTSILDIGTGSGCIAISLAKNNQKADVSALDISSEALKVAKQNAKRNKVAVEFFQKDILIAENLPKKYDIIVSNPPYVRELEKRAMQKNVLDHEPTSALFVSDSDPLLFYRTIAILAKKQLTKDGILYFEINEYLSKELKTLLLSEGFSDIKIKKDLFGKDRMLRCCYYE